MREDRRCRAEDREHGAEFEGPQHSFYLAALGDHQLHPAAAARDLGSERQQAPRALGIHRFGVAQIDNEGPAAGQNQDPGIPRERLSLHQIVVATAATAVAITFLSLALTLYVALGANFEQHYATSGLAVFVLLAVWLFLSNAMLLVGYKMALDVKTR